MAFGWLVVFSEGQTIAQVIHHYANFSSDAFAVT
jgi:hypothetical protein